ncbi:MAG: response regulator transcription factor [Candidatus Saccharibacteria bacterium]|nr:response regulator transcription factor [Candidatus Saccharibacteria bacterium]
MRILYVEDEKYLADAVVHMLKKDGLDVDWVADGEEGLELAMKPIYDAIILDVMLPKMSGFDILRKIREQKVKTPVIMLSALGQAEDKIRGLDYGADDYLAKPFKTAELIARLHALARRPALQDENILTFGDLSYDKSNRTLNGLSLTATEATLLESLLSNPDRPKSKEYLLAHIWGNEKDGVDNYVEVYISYLRKKIEKVSDSVQIKTIRSLGYKLILKNVK